MYGINVMGSENETPSRDRIAEMMKVIERLRVEGYLFNGPADDIASFAYRRWHSFDRRHKNFKNPNQEDRVRDLAKGLQAQFEPTGMYVHVEEWNGLAKALVDVRDRK